jgi:hypothetical protein
MIKHLSLLYPPALQLSFKNSRDKVLQILWLNKEHGYLLLVNTHSKILKRIRYGKEYRQKDNE